MTNASTNQQESIQERLDRELAGTEDKIAAQSRAVEQAEHELRTLREVRQSLLRIKAMPATTADMNATLCEVAPPEVELTTVNARILHAMHDDDIWTVSELSEQLDVKKTDVKKALDFLVDGGVVRRQSAHRYVRAQLQ